MFDSLEKFADATAVIDENLRHWSYRELVHDADALGKIVGQGKLIILVASNCYASIATYVGIVRSKSVPLLLPATTSTQDLEAIQKVYAADFIAAPTAVLENMSTLSGSQSDYTLHTHSVHSFPLMTGTTKLHKDLSLLLSTSGSTGSKSLVRLSRENIKANTKQIIEYLAITKHDRAITTMPMSYSYGLSIINTHLQQGASIIATENPLIKPDFWELLKSAKATMLGGVPFIYEMLKKLRFERMHLPSLKCLTQAGGALSKDLANYFSELSEEKGYTFVIMYGQTEATARISYIPPEKLKEKVGTIGTAIPSGELWLVNDKNEEIKQANMPGELVYKGPNVSMGYAESRVDLAKEDENNGTLYTGDIATRDIDGFYTIIGRKKRFLKLFGNRVNLAEIEQILASEGLEAACSGTDNALRIFVEMRTNIEEVKATLKKRTTLPLKGYRVIGIDKFPRSENGKISYHLLNEQFRAG